MGVSSFACILSMVLRLAARGAMGRQFLQLGSGHHLRSEDVGIQTAPRQGVTDENTH